MMAPPPKPKKKKEKKIKPINRKMRILVLCGRQSNEHLVKFQTIALAQAVGKTDAEAFYFLCGDHVWTYRPGWDLHDVDEMTIQLAKKQPFMDWFNHEVDAKEEVYSDMERQQNPANKVMYKDADKAVDKLLDTVNQKGIDVVVTLFEGSIVVHCAVARLISEGKEIPWRLSVCFNGMPIRDDDYRAPLEKKKADHPIIFVFGRNDEYYCYGRSGSGCVFGPYFGQRGCLPGEEYYEEPIVMLHEQGHSMPQTQPRQGEIFTRIVAEMKYQCGLEKEKPAPVKNPPMPFAPPCLDLQTFAPRKMRVLAMCGGHATVDIIKYQATPLRMALGKDDVDFTYLEGFKVWEWYEGEPEPSDFEKQITKGKPLKNWYLDKAHDDRKIENRLKQFDPKVFVEYYDVEESVRQLDEYIEKNGPFDCITGFSQAAIMVHLLIGFKRKKKEHMPWRCQVFFAPMHIRDKRYFDLFDTKHNMPTMMVFGKADEYYDYCRDGFGNKPCEEYYEHNTVMTHAEDHMWPSKNPDADTIYKAAAAEMWKWCGRH
eukprot:gnl/TRDRNA2_/TRDRNA2_81905_c0_seq1.p1 gnl/TRDRNA2_/TRDRNA2_81905_c0~~gnl/TRDRNA2_/TRDRNA2_81905_c0_seq1.p1  ORF type:complete len:558 (-),score=138.19 gnl/TRDRNA2_/TRDRNA2_81905_c0_seq1:50-1669(-)